MARASAGGRSRTPSLGIGWLVTLYVITRDIQDEFTDLRRQRSGSIRTADLAAPRNVAPRHGTSSHTMTTQNAAGALLIILPLAFNLFFFLLGRRFDYPDILRSPTGRF